NIRLRARRPSTENVSHEDALSFNHGDYCALSHSCLQCVGREPRCGALRNLLVRDRRWSSRLASLQRRDTVHLPSIGCVEKPSREVQRVTQPTNGSKLAGCHAPRGSLWRI